jgi:acyl-CoA thioester hydrolase
MAVTATVDRAVQYFECDRQEIAFHMWFLAWFDEAMGAWFDAAGLGYDQLITSGLEMVVRATEVNYLSPAHYRDQVTIAVAPVRAGTTSLTLEYTATCNDRRLARAETVYVCVNADGAPHALPPTLVAAVG